jgi:hypothetical protein
MARSGRYLSGLRDVSHVADLTHRQLAASDEGATTAIPHRIGLGPDPYSAGQQVLDGADPLHMWHDSDTRPNRKRPKARKPQTPARARLGES